MIKGLLVKLGIGSASVDLKVSRTNVAQGETLDVVVTAEGGWVDQEVTELEYVLRTKYRVETDEGETLRWYDIAEGTLETGFTLGSGESRRFEGSIPIPADAPLTEGAQPVRIGTALDVDWAADPVDRDKLTVQPGEYLAATFEALGSLGFHHHATENEKSGSTLRQEFEFRTSSGPFAGDLDELELVPHYRDDGIRFAVEVDESGGMLSEMAGTDETQTSVVVDEADPEVIAEEFRTTIEQNV